MAGEIANLEPEGQVVFDTWSTQKEDSSAEYSSYLELRQDVLSSANETLRREKLEELADEELEDFEGELDLQQIQEEVDSQKLLEAQEEFHGRLSEIQKNLDLLGSTLAVSEKARENEAEGVVEEPLEVRGWSVFSHVYDVHGDETFHQWPRVYDSDKYFPAVNGVENFLRNNIVEDFEKSKNVENHEGDKYTAHIDVYSDRGSEPFESVLEDEEQEAYEFDLMVPESEESSEYSHSKDDVERIQYTEDLSLLVPSVTELIRHKGTIERDNGEGNDPFREKDGNELLTLLYVAEQKGYEIEDLEEEYDDRERSLIGSRVREAAPKNHSELEASFTPESDNYLRAVSNWADLDY